MGRAWSVGQSVDGSREIFSTFIERPCAVLLLDNIENVSPPHYRSSIEQSANFDITSIRRRIKICNRRFSTRIRHHDKNEIVTGLR